MEDANDTVASSAKIVRAEECHVPGLLTLWKELIEFHSSYDSIFKMSDDAGEKMVAGWRRHFGEEDWLILVAIYRDDVIGYISAKTDSFPDVFRLRTYGVIRDAAVKEDFRRKGIGDLMLKDVLDWFRSKHITRVELKVAPQNEVAYSFWKKHGFKDYLHDLCLEL